MIQVQQVEEMLDQYRRWMRERTTLKEIGGWVEITTPYLDRHNDHIQIYARNQDGKWILSDDGYTISDLAASGCQLHTEKRKAILQTTLNGFAVKVGDHQDLITTASENDFPSRKHNLLQAIMAVGDLFYLAEPNVASLFHEDVAKWMKASHIRFSPDLKITGKSGFDFRVEFIVPQSDIKPERLIRLINNPTKDNTLNTIAGFIDIKEARPESTAYAVINDQAKDVPEGILTALRNYDIMGVPFSKRLSVQDDLAA